MTTHPGNPPDLTDNPDADLPPPLPAPDAPPDAWARYAQELEHYRALTGRMHARAQADTAVAMLRAAEANEALMRELLAQGQPPAPPDTAPDLPDDAVAEILAFVRRSDAMLKSY